MKPEQNQAMNRLAHINGLLREGDKTKVFNKLDDARAHALEQSKANPTLYYTIGSAFGWYVTGSKRLNVFSPSDNSDWSGKTGTYWLNGVEKKFSAKQHGADERATPTSY